MVMIPRIAKGLLKLLGHGQVVPFVDGLAQIGQPGNVIFPKELVGQGAGIILAGLNNTMAFQSNPDWIWPMWYERQRNADSQAFIPTGMNLVTSNITHRNWTSIGNEGSDFEIMVDPVGMVTMGPAGWSLLPYLREKGKLHVPSLLEAQEAVQTLDAQSENAVHTEYRISAKMLWSLKVEVVALQGEELVIVTQEIENRTNQTQRYAMGFSLRPYNVLNVFHIHRIKYLDKLWRINRKAALWVLEEPNRVAIGDRKQNDPIHLAEIGSDLRKITSRSGVAAGACEWDLGLEPWEKKRVVVVATLRKQKKESFPLFIRPTYERLVQARASAVNLPISNPFQIFLPEGRLPKVWKALHGRLHVFDDGDRFTPGTFLYHELWIRDSAFIAMLHTELGAHLKVAPKLVRFLKMQDRDGFFCSQTGEWDSNGEAIFAMVHHCICCGDQAMLEKCYPAIKAGAQWIGRQCAATAHADKPHRGLLPSGFSAEHFGPNDHYFWDNFWALKGLEDAAWAASVLGDHAAEKWMNAFASRLRTSIQEAIRHSEVRGGGRGLPSSPYRKVDSASIGNLVSVSPLGLVSSSEQWVRETMETLWQESTCQDMFFQKIVHTGLNAYLSIQLARVFLALDDSRWIKVFESVLNHASSTYTWPEAIHPRTGGGCMGDGDHGWAVSEVMSFMLSILVRVQEGVLLLGHGVPVSWYQQGVKIGVENACTRYGSISWTVEKNGNMGLLRWEIKRNGMQKRIPVSFRLPAPLGFSHPRLSSFAQGQGEILLPTDQGTLEIPLGIPRKEG